MTGTAVAVGEQLREFYDLQVAVIPPNVPCVRVDEPDRIYATVTDKERALVDEVAAAHATGRPVLIGTLDVAESERLAERLAAEGIDCVVLNAKNDAEEAGDHRPRPGRRARSPCPPRWPGGAPTSGSASDRRRVAELGGLYVIGTGRHASSRLDDQLRGRAGRQGDPGGSVFFVSLEDELITAVRPGRDPAAAGRRRRGAAPARPATSSATRSGSPRAPTWRSTATPGGTPGCSSCSAPRCWRSAARRCCAATPGPSRSPTPRPSATPSCASGWARRCCAGSCRQIVLYHLDECWSDHLAFLADLREGIHLRVLGRQNPLDEFHKESVRAFGDLLDEVARRSVETFEESEITEDGIDLDAAGLLRPSATWTYLVQDNPFGSEWDRITRRLSGRGRR